MSWKVRHEGSPQHVDLPTAQDVMQGLIDGLWEPTDEVRGPQDANWVSLETHPQFAEAASEIEPLPKMHEDESKLDMNALIDVCLVLLIFYILTTSYSQLQARIDNPTVTADVNDKLPIVTKDQIEQQMILVTVKLEKGKPVIRIEDKVVEERLLAAEFTRIARNKKTKTSLLMVFDADVTNGTLTAIEDAAAVAEIKHINWGTK